MGQAEDVRESLRCMALIAGNDREWWQEHVEEFQGHIDEGVEWICVPRTVEDVSTADMLRLVADAWDEAHPGEHQEASEDVEGVESDGLERVIGTALYGFVAAMVASGLSGTEAFRIAAFAVVEGTLGRQATRQLGVPSNTAARWRRDIAAASEAAPSALLDRELELKMMNELLPVMGMRDLRVSRSTDG
jgi:hypothetical protein